MTSYLNSKERHVFQCLHHLGKTTVGKLAANALINRTSLYPILERLEKQGLVTHITSNHKTYYAALTKAQLTQWMTRKQTDDHAAAEEFARWSQSLDGQADSLITDTRYYEGKEAVKSLYDETWRQNANKEILTITDYEAAYRALGHFFREDYFKKRIEKGIRVKSMLPESKIGRAEEAQSKALLRNMRFVDVFTDLGIELNIWDDKIAIVAFDENKPEGVLIQNMIIARAFKNIFSVLWEKASKP